MRDVCFQFSQYNCKEETGFVRTIIPCAVTKAFYRIYFFITNQHEIQDYAPISNLILTATVTLSIPDGFC